MSMEKTFQIPTFLNVDLSIELAKTWRRYFAYILDWIFKGTYIFLVIYISSSRLIFENFLVGFFVFTPIYFYTFLFEWLCKGQTLGKMIMKIKVVGEDGNAPSVSQCAVRWIFLFVDAYSTVLLSFLSSWAMVFAAFGPFVGIARIERSQLRQRFGDLAAGTFVVNKEDAYFTIEDTVYSYVNRNKNYVVTYPEVLRFSDKDLTTIKNLLDKSEQTYDADLLERLADRVKELLNIESEESDHVFLTKLLSDYNYLSLEQGS